VITPRDARSRKNEIYHSIPHINQDLARFFRDNPNAYIQGELFNPKYVNQLNRISELISVVRQPSDITPELLAESREIVQWHWYDGYGFEGLTQDSNGRERRAGLERACKKYGFEFVKPITYTTCYSFGEMKKFAEDYIKHAKGEGAIIRDPAAPYFHKRTKSLLKFKKCESEEFKVISVEEGTANWRGCASFVWLELPKGTRTNKFKSNISGKREHRRAMFEKRDTFIGKEVTVDFQEYSEYGVPQIPYTDMVVRKEVEG
jgi:hypothetical protein